MSWFLVEVDCSPKSYSIIHSMDLLEDSRNLYIDRTVKFKRDQSILSGKVICASDNRNFVEEELQKKLLLLEQNRSSSSSKLSLVQYSKGANNIIHSVIHDSEITWHNKSKEGYRDILIREGNLQRLATVLYKSNDESKINEELRILKTKCFDCFFKDAKGQKDAPWLLVQYSCGINNTVFAIINKSETVWIKENLYPDVVVYLSDGSTMYQAMVVKKSHNKDELDFDLKNIKDRCLLLSFPLGQKTEDTCIDYSMVKREPDNHFKTEGNFPKIIKCEKYAHNQNYEIPFKFIKKFEKKEEILEEEAQHLSIMRTLQLMDWTMRTEGLMINNAFEAIDRIKINMEIRSLLLDKMLQM